jgi:hypothetical protein
VRFPPAIDNTIVETFFACEGKSFHQYFEDWAPGTNVNLHAGGAFAKGMEAARKAFHIDGAGSDDAIALGVQAAAQAYGNFLPPPNSHKTFPAVLRAVSDYFFQYPLEEDPVQPFIPPGGLAAVEFNFGIPLPLNNPDTGEPLLYAGRCDMVGRYNDSIFVVDEKTTTSLGPSWERQWDLAGQFTGYCWAARNHGYPVAGAIIRGISFLKDCRFGHAQVVTQRTSYLIDFWYEQLLLKIKRMIQAYEDYKKAVAAGTLFNGRDAWQWSHGAACKTYGGCPFIPVCGSPNPDKVLEVYFVKRQWNPLHVGVDE